ncbi:Velvet complex subunit B [Vanrija pseudolonga]|uniref:Velvet complex subunit B n=1 Tax=Vanrija pseudolonga TaxID=143232 RepID=A0AAF0YDB5_9TREE|nr:Velvet complex subunit B [Vanrija pseudolonga]
MSNSRPRSATPRSVGRTATERPSTTSDLPTPGPSRGRLDTGGEWTPVTLIKSGMFAGRYMSFWLDVAQEPVHGRRKTEKDRRPLAPSPIVRLWIREHAHQNAAGVAVDPADIEVSHIVCAAELFSPQRQPTPAQSESSSFPLPLRETASPRRRTPSPARLALDGYIKRSPGTVSASPQDDRDAIDSRYPPTPPLNNQPPRMEEADAIPDDRPSSATRPPSQASEGSRGSRGSRGRSARVTQSEPLGDRPGSGSRKVVPGRNLYGNLHVAGVRVPAMEGGVGLWFLFTDLSIRNEGSYSLRFRCFDMTAIGSVSNSDPIPPLVECQSADFKVYSPRNFPGLPKPTELAEHFARQGYKLNTRKNERQAASPPASPSSATFQPDAAKPPHH